MGSKKGMSAQPVPEIDLDNFWIFLFNLLDISQSQNLVSD